jgi:hypothetical protein
VSPFQLNAGRVMVTDGGPHSAGAWAQVTAQHIAPLNPNLGGERYVKAMKLQTAIADALLPHHSKVQGDERSSLSKSHQHLLTPAEAHPVTVTDALNAIVVAAIGTEWESHYSNPVVQNAIAREIEVHFKTIKRIERSWHIDRHAHLPEFRSWAASNKISVPSR